MPASSNASRLDRRNALDVVRLSICDTSGLSQASPVPSTYTGGRRRSAARSAEVRTRAPPPSVTTQHSSLWNGHAMTRESRTSSTVTSLLRLARGLPAAQRLCMAGTAASWSSDVPVSCR